MLSRVQYAHLRSQGCRPATTGTGTAGPRTTPKPTVPRLSCPPPRTASIAPFPLAGQSTGCPAKYRAGVCRKKRCIGERDVRRRIGRNAALSSPCASEGAMSLGDSLTCLHGGRPFLPLLSDSSCVVEWTLTPVLKYHDMPQRFAR